MEGADKKLCPFCAGEIQSDAILCEHCRRDLRRMKIAKPEAQPESEDRYKIVLDGGKFGIAFRGKVIIHGMTLKEAENSLPILNSVFEETGKTLPR